MMNFQELTDEYRRKTDEFLLRIEQMCESPRKTTKIPPQAPAFVGDVIIPIYQSLAAEMGRKIKIPDPKTYLPIKGYYRIKVGVTTVGGFSVPDGGDYSIYFTPMKSAKPIGERQPVSNTEELTQLITNQLKTIKRLAI